MNRFRRLSTRFAGTVLLAAVTLVGSPAHAATVPNMYHCSNYTKQCWQTNPPHVASIINRCYWYNTYVYNAAWASTTCDKYTPR
ncbi:hypothetical protein GCM10009557_00440 [Virgisporangium ochraceum]|uniref:Secreted protein n=1 Tax=Virgisporangium ochraceum TaxID=65505 RepID=A0A8J4A760_9ACTN|nr:hypothetical protein Voc01_089930 [Virgisporangium ochraceum]